MPPDSPFGLSSPGHTAELAWRATFPLLGVPVEIRTNNARVYAAAKAAFDEWHKLPANLVRAQPPAKVDVVVHELEGAQPPGDARPFVYRSHGSRFLGSDGVNHLSAELDRGEAVAFITPAMVKRGAELRQNVLHLLALLLVTQHDRVPLHAAAVVLDGHAFVLAGPSTAGKSTLCYACARDGFQVLAEDAVYVAREPTLRLWGMPRQIHLLPDAVRFFPELASVRPETQPTGKFKMTIETARFGHERPILHAERATVCVVGRHDGPQTLIEPLAAGEAVRVLSADREPGFDLYDGAPEVAERLTASGAFRLIVGSDPCAAPQALRSFAARELSAQSGRAFAPAAPCRNGLGAPA